MNNVQFDVSANEFLRDREKMQCHQLVACHVFFFVNKRLVSICLRLCGTSLSLSIVNVF
jgi:hypothetical protein